MQIEVGGETHEVDYLCIAAGRGADLEGLGLEEAGVQVDEHGLIMVDGAMRTSLEGAYAIGDTVPGPGLAHKASDEGVLAAEDAAKRGGRLRQLGIATVRDRVVQAALSWCWSDLRGRLPAVLVWVRPGCRDDAGDSYSAEAVRVSCANARVPRKDQPVRLVRPETCNFPVTPPPGRAGVADAGHIYVEKMRKWRGWGRKVAQARGTFVGNMDFRKRIRVKLFGRRRCDVTGGGSFYVYTLVRFRGLSSKTSYVGGC